jgi:hypothetical protein
MPRVVVEYLQGFMNPIMATRLKELIRKDASMRFSTREHKLEEDDFTIIFNELSELSEATHPIVVRVELHNYPERLERIDTDAEEMATALQLCLVYAPSGHPDKIHIGVSILYSAISWGTSQGFFGKQ